MTRPLAVVSGSAATMRADACWSRAVANAGAIWLDALNGNESSSIQKSRAAHFDCVSSTICWGFIGPHINAAVFILGYDFAQHLQAFRSQRVVEGREARCIFGWTR